MLNVVGTGPDLAAARDAAYQAAGAITMRGGWYRHDIAEAAAQASAARPGASAAGADPAGVGPAGGAPGAPRASGGAPASSPGS